MTALIYMVTQNQKGIKCVTLKLGTKLIKHIHIILKLWGRYNDIRTTVFSTSLNWILLPSKMTQW